MLLGFRRNATWRCYLSMIWEPGAGLGFLLAESCARRVVGAASRVSS